MIRWLVCSKDKKKEVEEHEITLSHVYHLVKRLCHEVHAGKAEAAEAYEHEHEITSAHLYHMVERLYHDFHASGNLEKQLAPQLKGVLEDAVDVMRNPPISWHSYLKSRNKDEIARMEVKELIESLEEHKSSREIRDELVHALAALMMYAE